jgi:hypothetical protein
MSADIQTIGGSALAATQPSSGVALSFTDASGTPGNATINTPRGRCAIAAAASSVTITNSLCKTTSAVGVTINQAATDATLTSLLRVQTANGSFTITGNAAATAAVVVDFVLFP